MGERFYETDHYGYSSEYKALEKAISRFGNPSTFDFEQKLNAAIENNDLNEVFALTDSVDFPDAFGKIFARWYDVYKVPAGSNEDDFVFRDLTYYFLSDDIRRKVLEFCAQLPAEVADSVADVVYDLTYENHPNHKTGYSDSEKFEVLRGMSERGSKKSLEIIAKLADIGLSEARNYLEARAKLIS